MALEQLNIYKRAVEKGNAVLEWQWAVERYDDFEERCGKLARCSTLLLQPFGAGVSIPAGFTKSGVRA
jgi:hypothetical protein